MDTGFELDFLTPGEVRHAKTQLMGVYHSAFKRPPYNRPEHYARNFRDSLKTHTQRLDFRFLAAKPNPNGQVVGFGYGYTCMPGQWWYDYVAKTLHPKVVAQWLTGSFELVELAVLPEYQGQGIGSALHDQLFAGLPHKTAVLSTILAETPARHLYTKRGWTDLVDRIYFPGTNSPFTVMGIHLTDKSFLKKNEKDERAA